MSSPLFPGQIPLPGASGEPPAAAPLLQSASGGPAYDAATMAYYNAYYAQYNQYLAAMSAAGGAAAPYAYPAVAPHQQPLSQQTWPAAGVVPDTASTTVTGNGDEDEEADNCQKRNVLPVHGNEKTMNLNSLILTNIQQSNYFRNTLYSIKTFNELIDEIWENVKHCEPWERASRKVSLTTITSLPCPLVILLGTRCRATGQ